MTTDQEQNVKDQGHKVSLPISSKNTMARQRMIVSTSNLVEIFIVRGKTYDTLSRLVGELDWK